MHSAANRSFLLSLTLTELAFLLFFLVLLLATFQGRDLDRTERELGRMRQAFAMLGQDASGGPQAVERLADSMARLRGENSSLREELDEARRELALLEAQSREFEAVLKVKLEEAGADSEDFVRLIRQRAEERVALEERLQDIENLKAQIGFLQRRCGPTGFGPPPCWIDPDTGKIQYIFNVTIFENRIRVEKAWPASREEDAMRIPGAAALPGVWSDLASFREGAGPILEWSRRQEPECRHYVRIYDRAATKDAFKSKLLTVEGYFYKWLEP